MPNTATKTPPKAPPFGPDSTPSSQREARLFSVLRERMGWTDQFLHEINNPSYPALRDLDVIVKALHWTKTTGKKIVVLPDFDMDGITSGVIGYAGLSELGFDVELYVPDYRRGHDISPDAIDELVARHPGVEVIITCDGGVNSHEGIQRGRDLGLTMLITDHHMQLPTEPDGTATSPAHVIINPGRLDETYPHSGICGAFVLYQVLMAYANTHAPHKVGDIALLRLFAGIGTVSDVMPLQFENRQIVKDSLSLARMLRHNLPSADSASDYDVDRSVLMGLLNSQLEHGDHHPVFVRAFRGFALMLQAWRETGKLASGTVIESDFYGFYLAPAFNALRRVEAPMHFAFDVFTDPDPQKQLAAAEQIIAHNEERKELVKFWMDELENRDQPLAPHVWLTNATPGMLGLLAGKLMQEHGVPVVVVNSPSSPLRPHSGSARAPMWFSVISTLTAHGFIAVGHEQACGVRASSFDELSQIAQLLADETAVIAARSLLEQSQGEATPEYDLVLGIDMEGHPAPDGDLDDIETLLEVVQRIESLGPFGHEFSRPRVRLVVNLARCSMQVIGQDQTHLKVGLPSGMKLLWWSAAEQLPDLKDLAGSPLPGRSVVEFDVDLSLNRFMGNESPQAVVEQIITAEP